MHSLILTAVLLAAPADTPPASPTFLVHEGGLVFLDADGREVEKLEPLLSNGALSADGRWLACLRHEVGERRGKLALRARGHEEPLVIVPEVTVGVGDECALVWSPDSKRLFIGESRAPNRGVREYRYRVYDLAAKKLTDLKLPEACWVTDWSRDGKRLLGAIQEGSCTRVAWVNADGKGDPEYVTPEGERAAEPRLSPDGRKVLCKVWIAEKEGTPERPRLCVLDLATKKRVVIDEPGEVGRFCWSPGGSRVAYAWQKALARREDAPLRETFLYTCDADGKGRKAVTSRKYRPVNSRSPVAWYFDLVDWR